MFAVIVSPRATQAVRSWGNMASMFLAAVLAFVGVVVGLLGAAALVKRFFDQRDLYLFAWAMASLALAAGLAGMSLGAALGFDGTTFRVMMLGISFLAPLWLAWGLVELVAEGMPSVFGARLLVVALTIVGAVILMIDPLSGKFGTEMPVASEHYQLFPMAALGAGYVAAGLTLVVYLIFAIVRRTDHDGMPRMLAASAAGGGGVLTVVSSALGLPAIVHAFVATAATVAIWYGGSRRAVPPEEDDEEFDEPTPQPMPPRGRRARHGASPLEQMRREEAANRVGDSTEPSPEVDPTMGGPVATGAHAGGPGTGQHGREPRELPAGDRPYGEQPYGEPPDGDRGVNGAGLGLPVATGLHRSADIGPSPHLYGFILIYTLADGQGARFDQLTQETLAYVRENEPDTLIYVAHTVPNAPLQRIFYEVYRNRAAYDEHGRQPHVQRFHAERAACVLATNVIELKLEAAKITPVGPLFGDPTRR